MKRRLPGLGEDKREKYLSQYIEKLKQIKMKSKGKRTLLHAEVVQITCKRNA